jgi:16S rRNA (cytosine967-C5)-methyltransferase
VRGGEPLDRALDQASAALSDGDRRLAYEITAGILRSRQSLDARLAPLAARGWAGVAPVLQDVLRIGAYQLTALDRVPAHAAVSTSVELAREAGGAPAGRFVNAMLRRLADAPTPRDAPDAPQDEGAATDPVARLAERYSHPAWLVRRWVERFGEGDAEELLRRNNLRPELVLQPARASLDTLQRRWEAAGIATRRAPEGAGLLTGRSRPADLPGFAEGDFVVQDPAQALVARFAAVPPDAVAYDACAAPGGKAIALGRSARLVVAGDVSRIRSRRLRENVARAGSGRERVIVADARHPPVRPADVVLLDAPCLGTGTFARHPDARWRVSEAALAGLAAQQAELLESAGGAVAPGGLVVYATCSIEPEENESQVDRFLARHPEFRRDPPAGFPPGLLSPKGDLMLLPQRHGTDGGFAARLRRA